MLQNTWLRGEIVTTGTEILLGQIVDTNAAWIARQLNAIGVNLYYKSTVGDNEDRLRTLLQVCMARSDVVIVTGGLGPTADDITREAIAGAAGVSLVIHQPTLENLRRRFSNWGTRMTANNRQQALIPAGAEIVPNPVGTAPGFRLEKDSCTLFALPGVPREMKRLMQDTVLPFLQARTQGKGVIRTRTLRTIGIGESTIDHEIRDLMASPNPTVGLAAHTGQADIRLTARSETATEAETMLDTMEGMVRARVGQFIYSAEKDKDIAEYIAALLREQGERLVVWEQHTQGMIAARLQRAAGNTVLESLGDEDETLRARVRACMPPADAEEEAYEAALSRIAQVIEDARADASYLIVLGTTSPDHGVYQPHRGFTRILCKLSAGVRRARINFGGTDELTATWIGNRCFDLIRRTMLGLDPA